MLPSRFVVAVVAGLLMVVLPTSLCAQEEAFYGTWVLKLAKSSITRGGPPKSETVVNAAEPGGFRSTLTVVSERGTSVEIHHYVFDGAFHATEGSDPRELSVRRIAPTTIEQQTRRNGQITVTRRIQLSNDGRTMTFVASGTAGNGMKYENDTRVYEKQ